MVKKTLIVFFSRTFSTKKAAETIQKITNADLVELKRRPNYVDSMDELELVTKGEKVQHQVPGIEPLEVTLADYDLIYLGFPTWWYQPPMVIEAFFKANQLGGKHIIPFTTSTNSSIEDSVTKLQEYADGAGAVLETGFTANSSFQIRKALHQLKREYVK